MSQNVLIATLAPIVIWWTKRDGYIDPFCGATSKY